MLLKKSFSTADQIVSRPLMRFSDKNVREPRLLVKRLTGDFDNGLGAILVLSFVSFEQIARRHFGTFSTASANNGHSKFFAQMPALNVEAPVAPLSADCLSPCRLQDRSD